MTLKKTPSDSCIIITGLIPSDKINRLKAMFDGELLARMDRAASIVSQRHPNRATITVSMDRVVFTHNTRVGSVTTVEAAISCALSTSMEVYIDVWMENMFSERVKATEAIYSPVAVDENGRSVKISELVPKTALERERYREALQRQQLNLVLAGKLSPHDATELKILFAELESGK